MALKKYKPTSPGRRFMTVSDFAEVTKAEPEKSLVESVSRNQDGQEVVRGTWTNIVRGVS